MFPAGLSSRTLFHFHFSVSAGCMMRARLQIRERKKCLALQEMISTSA